MARKIAFIGAGSIGFTRSLVRDLLSFPALADAHIALMDINAERLDYIRRAVERIVAEGKYPAKVVATLDRKEALMGADGVVTTILHGEVDVWQHDILIPKKYGVDTNVGDTRGPSGIFRFLRTVNGSGKFASLISTACAADTFSAPPIKAAAVTIIPSMPAEAMPMILRNFILSPTIYILCS